MSKQRLDWDAENFEDELNELIEDYSDMSIDTIISSLEQKVKELSMKSQAEKLISK